MGAANAIRRVLTDYGRDPDTTGESAVHDALMRLHGFLVPTSAGGYEDPGRQFFGYANVQSFTGFGESVATASLTRDGQADLSDAITSGPMGDPARRIFAARLKRGRVGYV